MSYVWRKKFCDNLDNDRAAFLSSIGNSWSDDVENNIDILYKEHKSIIGQKQADFIKDITSNWLSHVYVGNPKGQSAFVEWLKDEQIGLDESCIIDEWRYPWLVDIQRELPTAKFKSFLASIGGRWTSIFESTVEELYIAYDECKGDKCAFEFAEELALDWLRDAKKLNLNGERDFIKWLHGETDEEVHHNRNKKIGGKNNE